MLKAFDLKHKIREKRMRSEAILTAAVNDKGEVRELTSEESAELDQLKGDMTALKGRVQALEDLGDPEDPDLEVADDPDMPAEQRELTPAAARPVRRVTPPIDPESGVHAPAVHTKKHTYSLCKTLTALAEHRSLDGLEGEWSARKAEERHRQPRGFYVPHNYGNPKFNRTVEELEQRRKHARLESRALTLTTGAGAIPLQTENNLIDFLYNRTVLIKAGATVITDAHTAFRMPRQDTSSTFAWVNESVGAPPSNITNDAVTFTPKTLTANIGASRLYIKQATVNAEAQIRSDFGRQMALGFDWGGLLGTGVGNVPLGVFNDLAVATYSLASNNPPNVPTWASIVALEGLVASQNADTGRMGYICNAKARSTLKTTPKIGSTYPDFLINSNDTSPTGYPIFVTNQIPNTFTQGPQGNPTATGLTAIAFGNWEDLTIALFDAMDVIVNPYSFSTTGDVIYSAFQEADIHLKHEQSIATLLFQNNN